MLAGGHILLESVPGLAKTLAASTLARAVGASFRGSSARPTCCPATSSAPRSTTRAPRVRDPARPGARQLRAARRDQPVQRQDPVARCSRRCRSGRPRSAACVHPLPSRSWCWPPRTRSRRRAPTSSRRRRWTASCSRRSSTTRPEDEFEVLDRTTPGPSASGTRRSPRWSRPSTSRSCRRSSGGSTSTRSIKRYIVDLGQATRNTEKVLGPELGGYVEIGASPRGTIAFFQVARALALLNGRDHVIPEDVRQLRHGVLRHRLLLNFEALADGSGPRCSSTRCSPPSRRRDRCVPRAAHPGQGPDVDPRAPQGPRSARGRVRLPSHRPQHGLRRPARVRPRRRREGPRLEGDRARSRTRWSSGTSPSASTPCCSPSRPGGAWPR